MAPATARSAWIQERRLRHRRAYSGVDNIYELCEKLEKSGACRLNEKSGGASVTTADLDVCESIVALWENVASE